MSEFENELDRKVAELRARISQARADDDDFKAESLVEELSSVVSLASDNDVDTTEMERILAVETGAIPVITPAAPEAR